jgi:porin
MTGNWDGLRDKLEKIGITVWANYTTDLLGNVSGGVRRGFQYAGGLEFGWRHDFEKQLGFKGLVFDVSGDYRSGWDLSERNIGSVTTAAQIFGLTDHFGTGSLRLYRLSLEQSLLDDRLSLLAGRIGMGDDFITSDLYGTFVQAVFNSNATSVTANIPSFSSGPVATWGLRAKFEPVKKWYVMGGVYYSDDTIGKDSKHGVDFSIRRTKGATSILQIGYEHNQGKDAEGLPGNYYVGSYYNSNRFENLADSDKARHGNYGLYFYMDQAVYREEGSTGNQGLTPFLTATFAPLEEVNTFPYFVAGGLVYRGLIPGRDNDTTSWGFAYGQFSNSLNETYEMVLELTHNFQLTPWLSIQPDLQYIIRPGGTGNISDAFVLGGQIVVDF